MGNNFKQGQYTPRQTNMEIPQAQPMEMPRGTVSLKDNVSANRNSTIATRSQATTDVGRKVEDLINEIKKLSLKDIQMIREVVEKANKSLVISIPDDTRKQMDSFHKDIIKLNGSLSRSESLASTVNRGLRNVLFFVAGIVLICSLLIFYAGQKQKEARDKISEADYRMQVADSLVNEAHDQIFKVDRYRDYGIWMVNHYGTQSCYYRRFLRNNVK